MHCAKDRKLYKKVQRRTPPLTKQNIFVLFWTLQEYDMNQCFIFFNYDQEKCLNFWWHCTVLWRSITICTGEIHISIFQQYWFPQNHSKRFGSKITLGDLECSWRLGGVFQTSAFWQEANYNTASKLTNYMQELHTWLDPSFLRCFVHLARHQVLKAGATSMVRNAGGSQPRASGLLKAH